MTTDCTRLTPRITTLRPAHDRSNAEGLLRLRPNERPFVITRATYAGGQRYAAQWTGDNVGTSEDLRTSLRTVIDSWNFWPALLWLGCLAGLSAIRAPNSIRAG